MYRRSGPVSPRETIARLRPLIPRMGITRVANVTGLDRIGIPVVTVCRPNARSLAVSQGKGVDLDAATVSGLMEAAELYHAEHVELPLKLGSQAELQSSHRFVDIDRLPHVAGGRFHRDLVTLWVEGRDLVTDESPTSRSTRTSRGLLRREAAASTAAATALAPVTRGRRRSATLSARSLSGMQQRCGTSYRTRTATKRQSI